MRNSLKKQVSALLLTVLLAVSAWQWTWAAVSPLTEENVYNAMAALKSEYPEGMSWTNGNRYDGTVIYWDLNMNGWAKGGLGCAGFAWILSDAAFGDLPATVDRDTGSVRVGDILRINQDTHSVVVLERDGDTVTVAEGNFNYSIHWGRKLSLSELAEDPQFMRITRWPEAEEPETETETAPSAAWVEDDGIWYYQKSDGTWAMGWEYLDGVCYYFNAYGQMLTDWVQDVEGTWYFLNTEHDGTYGRMLQSEWKWIDGYCYYFDNNGAMAADCETPDHYQVNASGQWVVNGVPQYDPGASIWTK